MHNPREKRLGDIVNFKRGYDLPSYNRVAGQYPIISSSGISGYHSEYKVDGEGLVTGRYGTLGEMHYVNGKYWPHNTALYATDFKGNYPKYVYYLMKCLGNLKTSDKSTVPGINRNDLHEVIVPFIGREYQEQIADFLFQIDTKIELNNRINAELEAMAKTLYDYWFVQFDFPDANGKPYKASGGKMEWNEVLKRDIPEGWEVENIEKCCSVIDCLHSKKSELIFENEKSYLIQLENIKDDGLIDLSNKYYVTSDEYKKWTSRIEVTDGDIVITNAGRVAATAQLPLGMKAGIGRNITSIRPERINCTYLFLTFRGVDIQRQIKLNTDSGAFFTSFNVKGIKKLQLLRPKNRIEEQFEELVLPIRRKRELNNNENQKLSELRDWLLPMLMNGQVKVGGYAPAEEEDESYMMAAEPEVAYDITKKLNVPENKKAFAKQVLAGKIINTFIDDPNLTHIKFQKLQYLAEHIIEADLNWNYYRQAAGPYDPSFMHTVHNKLKTSKWFEEKKYRYHPLEKVAQIEGYYQGYFSPVADKIDELFTCFFKETEEQAEIAATLYAVWNNFLINKAQFTDADLVKTFFEWSDRKAKYTTEQVTKCLNWMKEKNLVPVGWGKLIKEKK